MRRLTLWAARIAVGAALKFIGSGKEESEPETNDDDDLPMPAGHPIVVRSDRATAMIEEGARFSRREFKRPEPEAPLAGSLADRIARRDL